MSDYRRIKRHIIKKLYLSKCWKNGHMLEENILKGIPRDKWKWARKALQDLVQIGIIKVYGKTKHGIAYQLNSNHITRIEEIVNEEL